MLLVTAEQLGVHAEAKHGGAGGKFGGKYGGKYGGATGVTEFDAADVAEPYVFEAVTVNVYAVPLVSPETVIGDAPVPVKLPGLDVAVYVTPPEPTEPAVYVTVADALPAVAVPIVGAPGPVPFTTEFDAAEVAETPYPVIVETVNVYDVPSVNPLTDIGEPEPLPVIPPGLDVARYVAVPLPSYAAAVNETFTTPFPAAAETPVGGSAYLPPLASLPINCIMSSNRQ